MGVIKSNRMAVSSLRKQTIMRLLQLMVCSAAIAISFVARAQQIEQEPVPINMGDIMYGGHPIFQGYWHNLCGGVGYRGGTAACLQLTEVPSYYNVVAVAYMKSSNALKIPTFIINPSTGMTEQNFLQQVRLLNSQGRFVILALGGPDSRIALTIAQGQQLTNEIIRLVWAYGFSGLTLDLKRYEMSSGSNQSVIPQALIAVRYHFATRRTYFSISASPDLMYIKYWPYHPVLKRLSTVYKGYIRALQPYIDWISPHFFDVDDEWRRVGVWCNNHPRYPYRFSKQFMTGTSDWILLPIDKLVMGVPTNYDASPHYFQYAREPQMVFDAFRDLSEEGYPLRGIMAWSINWDLGVNDSGISYNGTFAKAYGPMIFPNLDEA